MKKYTASITFLFLIFLWVAAPLTAQPSGSSDPQVLLTTDGLQLKWQLPPLIMLQRNGQLQLEMAGFTAANEPGALQLPQRSWLLALPPLSAPVVTVISADLESVLPQMEITRALQPSGLERDETGQVIGGGWQTAVSFPEAAAEPVIITDLGMMRGVRLARLTLTPALLIGEELHHYSTLVAQINFQNSLSSSANSQIIASDGDDPIWPTLTASVLNPSQIQAAPKIESAANIQGQAPNTAIIEVDQPGITRVTYNELLAAGFPMTSVNAQLLQLSRNGEEVALHWLGDGDTQFESGESFRFYTPTWADRWERNAIYVLTTGASNGLRMSTVSASPDGLPLAPPIQTTLFEEDHIYTPDCLCGTLPLGRDGDRWVWADLRRPGRPTANFQMPLPEIDSGEDAEITLWLLGFTSLTADPDHNLRVSWNGANLGTINWDGKTAITSTLTIPAAILQPANTLTLTLPASSGTALDGIWFDAAMITGQRAAAVLPAGEQLIFRGLESPHAYTIALANSSGARIYDVSNPTAPRRLTNVTVNSSLSFGDPDPGAHDYVLVANSSLHSAAEIRMAIPRLTGAVNGADFVVIAPQPFITAVSPLVQLRQTQGLTVAVEDVQAIYDQFGNGRADPQAIQDFLREAFQNWNPAPAYVLLVGDGTSDPKQNHPETVFSWIHPFLADVDPWAGEVAADNRFVMVDGDDVLPDMMIGRLPANNVGDVEAMVSKIVAYETAPVFGEWNGRILSVADDSDNGGNFASHSESLIDPYNNAPWSITPMYYSTETDLAFFQKEVEGFFSSGPGLILYNGHSSIHQWGAERYFHLDDVGDLANNGQLPVVLQMTCFTGSFHQPFWNTLDEALVRLPLGGAIAVWGATGLGVGTGHEDLATGFLQSLIGDQNPDLGSAVIAGKLHLLTNKPAHLDLLDTFTFLGDPATQYNLDLLIPHRSYLPLLPGQ